MRKLRELRLILSLVVTILTLAYGFYTQWNQTQPPILGQEREQVKVAEVVDGDTIRLVDGRTLRYIGIDTPETKHPTVEQECFGQEAAAKNKELVEGKVVELEKDVNETDKYGRLLRYVWLDGQLVNEVLVAEGYAVARSYPPDVARQEQLRLAEAKAMTDNKGLWSTCPSQNVLE